jgi:ATP-dependent HslUV protease ATP-binding subunit HslU
VGRDVDTIIRDLEVAIKQTREQAMKAVRDRALDAAEERRLMRCCRRRVVNFDDLKPTDNATRQKFRKMLREGQFDDKEIEIEVAVAAPQMEVIRAAGHGRNHAADPGHVPEWAGPKKMRKMKIDEAMKLLQDEAAKLVNEEELKQTALDNAEQNGIVFLDEIDKIAARQTHRAPTCRARACSATCCRWSRARRSTPSTVQSRPITSCSSPAAPST